MAIVLPITKWGIIKGPICYIRVFLFINTFKNKSRKHSSSNTLHYTNYTNIQRQWKRQRHTTWQFGHGGCHLGLQVQKHFVTWTSGWHFGIFGINNGKSK